MRLSRLCSLTMAVSLAVVAVGCLPADAPPTAAEMVEHTWGLVDARYALFADKPDVDWPTARRDALAALGEAPTDTQLFGVLAGMLTTLDDQHTNLLAPFDVSGDLVRTLAVPRLYDADRVERQLFATASRRSGSLLFGLLSTDGEPLSIDGEAPPDAIGYLRLDDFDGIPGDDTLDGIFETIGGVSGLILDLRSNGGGSLEAMFRLAGRFYADADGLVPGLHYQFADGPAHDALTAPDRRDVSPIEPGYAGRVVVLIDGHSYSAANALCFVLRHRDDVVFVGQPTGGGGGLPVWVELPNGWRLRLSTGRLTDRDGTSLEPGLAPDHPAELGDGGSDEVLRAGIRALMP